VSGEGVESGRGEGTCTKIKTKSDNDEKPFFRWNCRDAPLSSPIRSKSQGAEKVKQGLTLTEPSKALR
jgi:hypothetical protein